MCTNILSLLTLLHQSFFKFVYDITGILYKSMVFTFLITDIHDITCCTVPLASRKKGAVAHQQILGLIFYYHEEVVLAENKERWQEINRAFLSIKGCSMS